MKTLGYAISIAAAIALAAVAGAAQAATATLKDVTGVIVGNVDLEPSPHGVLLKVTLTGLPPGEHAFHLHETAACVPPFTSAGGHFNPFGKEHGLLNPKGRHAGDLPNIVMPDGDELNVNILADLVTLEPGKKNSLFDSDGTAIVIHVGPDDYITDPTGSAGRRIACGVIVP